MLGDQVNGQKPSEKIREHATVARRVDLSCDAIGFSAPPCRVQIRFTPHEDDRWTLVALTPPAQPPAVARWLEAYEPTAIHVASGLAPKALRATFDDLPEQWARILEKVRVRFVELTPDGAASLFIKGSPDEVQGFIESVRSEQPEARTRQTRSDDDVSLSPRQMEVLSRAVGLGYYEIPHNITLRDLAERLDLTVGTVSELLRRAEGQILTSYVDAHMVSKWEDGSEIDATEDWEAASRA